MQFAIDFISAEIATHQMNNINYGSNVYNKRR